MKEFPHRYIITAYSATAGDVRLAGERLPDLASASPAEFGGRGDQWSPETLLVAAVGDCFVLTFRAVAAASKLEWRSLACSVTGTLDRVERVTQFTAFEVRAELELAPGTDAELARRAVDKAERNCLVSNSLKASVHVVPMITIAWEPVRALVSVQQHAGEPAICDGTFSDGDVLRERGPVEVTGPTQVTPRG